MAQSWLVFELTHSAFLLGLVGFLSLFPVFLFSLIGGAVADRVNKRRILLWTQTVFMLLAFLLAVLTQVKMITPLGIMIIAALNGIIMAFDAPARQTMVIELVGKKHLANAIALNSIAFNASRMIGPVLAGIFVAAIGLSGCFFINGFSFLGVLIALNLIRSVTTNKPNGSAYIVQDCIDGLRFVRSHNIFLVLISLVGATSLFGVSYMILMPIFAADIFHKGAVGLGQLMSASGCGALIGGIALARYGERMPKGRVLFICVMTFSLALIGFAASRVFIISLLFLVLIGASSVTAMSLVNTILQSAAPDQYRGRLMSVYMLTFSGMVPFGNLLAGWLAHAVGVSAAVLAGGIFGLFCVVLLYAFNPQIREL